MLVHGDPEAHLLSESQGQGVGSALLLLQTAPQVGVVVAPAPPQPVAISVEPQTWHEDEVKSPCGERSRVQRAVVSQADRSGTGIF